MELYSADAKSLQGLLKDWFDHPTTELEATFGEKGRVDAATFLAIAARLKSLGFKAKAQIDRLSIILPDQVRFQLNGFGVIQQYCRDDRIGGKPFEAMIKDRNVGPISNLDLKEYNVRIKSRREESRDKDHPAIQELVSSWGQQRKAFRLIRRWSFEGKGIVFDLSMVRSSLQDTKGQFRWVRNFGDFNIMSTSPTYEIEVELLRDAEVNPDISAATKSLIAGLTTILRGIQKNFLLIRNSAKASVLASYKELTGTDRFRGVNPITLETTNMRSTIEENVHNIRNGYNVTEKADGIRVHAFCDKRGELYMIDMGMNVYRTGLTQPDCKNSLLDGEFVTRDKDNKAIQQLLLFDIYIAPGSEDVTKLPFYEGRHTKLEGWIASWNNEKLDIVKGVTPETQLQVAIKKFVFGGIGDASIFRAANSVLGKSYPYHTDGLIFTSNSAAIPQKPGVKFTSQFKWKPAEENTIDFYALIEKHPENPRLERIQSCIHPDNGETVSYKTLRLFVGSGEDTVDNPRQTVLFEKIEQQQVKQAYKPVLFNPKENPDTMASVCYIAVENDLETGEQYIRSERNGEVIRDKSILEMAYDPARSPGWRWYPLRVRTDKTERLVKGFQRTLNDENTAESVWNSIHDPVTRSMITTGNDEPTADEISALLKTIGERAGISKTYYGKKAPRQDTIRVRGLRDFHNLYIKNKVLYDPVLKPGGKTVLDLAVGKAGDLSRWLHGKVSFVLGIDYSGENILDPGNGAYSRLLGEMQKSSSVPPIFFAIGDSSKNLKTGEAGITPEESNIIRSILGTGGEALPPLVENQGAGRLRMGVDVITCMFAVHYFFQNAEVFSGFLKNIQENLKVGGYFIGCAFDGERVFELLRRTSENQSRVGIEDNITLWTIKKGYFVEEIPLQDEGFGLPIDVEFISIGSAHREYLVPFPLLVEKLKTIGVELLKSEQAAAIGLKHSSAMFGDSYKIADPNEKKYHMKEAVKQFSFLNRWFVFKRTGDGSVAAPAIEVVSPEVVTESIEGVVPSAAPSAVLTVPTGKYTASEVINFYTDAGSKDDKLGIKDPGFARYLAPSTYFSIPDQTDPKILYPSLEHFMAAMKYKIATNKPEYAKSLFSLDGTIYTKYVNKRTSETRAGAVKLSEDRNTALLKEETTDIQKETAPTGFRNNKAEFDKVTWDENQDELIRYALTYRYEHDERFRKIVEAARTQGKILLYYVNSAASELGGRRRTVDGTIEGQNKIGKTIMSIAGFAGF